MAGSRQTVERRQLGLMLQTMRMRTGASQKDAADAIGRQQVRISQMETGNGALNAHDLAALLDFYGASPEDRQTALDLGVEARRRKRRRAYSDVLPDAFQRLADLQADATAIGHYECGVIPGPLQSRDYVRGIVRIADGLWWRSSPEEVESRIEFRLIQQQRVLGAELKDLTFVFTESALYDGIGGRPAMDGQVIHMLNLVENISGLSIRIIPTGTHDNPALGGGLIVMDFETAPRTGCVAALYGPCTYYDHVEDTGPMMLVFNRVRDLALSEEDSRALLIRFLKEK